MNIEVKAYIEKYPSEVKELFGKLRLIVLKAGGENIEEKLWAKLPSYYLNEKFVRLIPFKDHVTIEAVGLKGFFGELEGYKITPKGMLQVFCGGELPEEILLEGFTDTFMGRG